MREHSQDERGRLPRPSERVQHETPYPPRRPLVPFDVPDISLKKTARVPRQHWFRRYIVFVGTLVGALTGFFIAGTGGVTYHWQGVAGPRRTWTEFTWVELFGHPMPHVTSFDTLDAFLLWVLFVAAGTLLFRTIAQRLCGGVSRLLHQK